MSDFPRLHDATLRSLSFNWDSGEVKMVCETASGPVAVIATAVREIKCSRTMPWGPSASINGILLEASNAAMALSIEMQSGDHIEVACENATASPLTSLG